MDIIPTNALTLNLDSAVDCALLLTSSSTKDIVVNESNDVIEYLNTNTKTNNQGSFGLLKKFNMPSIE